MDQYNCFKKKHKNQPQLSMYKELFFKQIWLLFRRRFLYLFTAFCVLGGNNCFRWLFSYSWNEVKNEDSYCLF